MMYLYTPEQHAQILDAMKFVLDSTTGSAARNATDNFILELRAMQLESPVGEVVKNVGPRLYKIEDRSNWGMLLYTPTKD